MRVSVVVPVLNGEAFLEEALHSVRQQVGHEIEILVVDDGSTDGSLAIAGRLADRVLRTTGRTGPSRARNLGVQEASADLIAFLDADDCWLPGHLDEVSRAFMRQPNAELCFSRVRAFGSDQYTSDAGKDIPQWVAFDARVPLIARNIVPQSSVVLRKELFVSAGGYDVQLRFAEDFDLWNRLASRALFVYVPVVTALYRVHPTQASKQMEQLLRSGWEVRLRRFLDLYATDQSAATAAAVRLSDTWSEEARWAIREGKRAWHHVLLDAREGLSATLGTCGLPAPAVVPWSHSHAMWYRVRRLAKRVLEGASRDR